MIGSWFAQATLCLLAILLIPTPSQAVKFSPNRMRYYRDRVKTMFYHAYNGYLTHAYPLDELKPITCKGMDTWGSFSLTLIDSLDTLLIMGNQSEFIRAAEIVLDSVKVEANVNVSVFETNIRVVGGLLTAHLLSGRVPSMQLEVGWPCSGPLLRLAERFAQKLLPAFNTDTGMPYGTVNLRYGVHRAETPITCTAGVGTMILEFGALSRITGNPMYERVALKALDALWKARSPLGLVGNHINVQTGEWTATDAGIGAGVDSYFEYLAKGALFFQRPRLMHQFNEYVKAINKHVRKSDWFMWVSMNKGSVSLPIFQSLEAFWPGVLALTGNLDDAQRILFQYSHIIRQYGFPPEFYNIPSQEAVAKRSGYPLRPEFVESLYYIYKATRDPALLELGASIVEAIEHTCRTSCGYATVENVNDHTIEDRMESFFLSETTKYLYLLFDPDNFINNDGTTSRTVETPNGPCIVDAGGYIFNTEAHPLDPAAIYCCSAKRNQDIEVLQRFEDSIDLTDILDLTDPFVKAAKRHARLYQEQKLPDETLELSKNSEEERYSMKLTSEYGETTEEGDLIEADQSDINESGSDGNARDKVDDLWKLEPTSEPAVLPKMQKVYEKRRRVKKTSTNTKADRTRRKMKRLLNHAMQLEARAKREGVNTSDQGKSTGKRKVIMDAIKSVQKQMTVVMNESKRLETVEKQLELIWVPVAECKDCCRELDAKLDSVGLRSMLSSIYGNYIYPKNGIVWIEGPVCSPSEEPTLAQEYNTDWPDVSEIETDQLLDAIDEIRINSVMYHSLAKQHYELLSTPPLSYLSQFTGLGQATLSNETLTG